MQETFHMREFAYIQDIYCLFETDTIAIMLDILIRTFYNDHFKGLHFDSWFKMFHDELSLKLVIQNIL